jgi:hypothetical protein
VARAEEILAVTKAQVDLYFACRVGRQRDFQLAGRQSQRADEASSPPCGEKLFGIGPQARGAWRGQFNIESAIGTARCAIASAYGAYIGGVNQIVNSVHKVLAPSLFDDKSTHISKCASDFGAESIDTLLTYDRNNQSKISHATAQWAASLGERLEVCLLATDLEGQCCKRAVVNIE